MSEEGGEEGGRVARSLLATWGTLWGRPGLEDAIRVEISRRLTRALGITHPARGIVRIAHAVTLAPREAFAEVLCHEAAHVVVFERHRRRVRPHGPEWAALLRAAGYAPRTRIDPRELGVAWAPRVSRRRRPTRWVYEHRCRSCGMVKPALRAVPQWRCARCRAAGFEGELEIVRWPVAVLSALGRRRGIRSA